MRVTPYDRAIAAVVAVFCCIAVLCVLILTSWASQRAPKPAPVVPVELVELPGGFADGFVDETLRVDSPLPEVKNASPLDDSQQEVSEGLEIAASVESAADFSGAGTAQPTVQQFESGVKNVGRRGSAKGTGRRALGSGNGKSGFPREQRWFVRFGERVDLAEYSRQLDFFGIELGALLKDGRLVYLSQVSSATPKLREVRTGKDEARLYMTWHGGERRAADSQLFGKVGVDIAADVPLFHFYPAPVEAELAKLERAYRNKSPSEIKRTYFVVETIPKGYRFTVVRQIFF